MVVIMNEWISKYNNLWVVIISIFFLFIGSVLLYHWHWVTTIYALGALFLFYCNRKTSRDDWFRVRNRFPGNPAAFQRYTARRKEL